MKTLAQVLCGLLLVGCATAQDHAKHAQAQSHSVTLVTGLGDLHHPISTHNPEAQKFFDKACASFTRSTTMRRHVRSSMQRNSIRSLPWLTGALPKRSDPITTTLPIPSVSRKLMTPLNE